MTDDFDEIYKKGEKAIQKWMKERAAKGEKIETVKNPISLPPPSYILKTEMCIDDLFGLGLPEGRTVLAYGEYASGKTQTVFKYVSQCPDIIIYVDTEDTFSGDRLKEICDKTGKDWKDLDSRIILIKPRDWMEQVACIYDLPSPADLEGKKVGLIIVDSLMKLFGENTDFQGREHLYGRQNLIKTFLHKLKDMARDIYHCPVIVTTQVYDDVSGMVYPEGKWMCQRPMGGHALLHFPDYTIFFRKAAGNARIARLMDNSSRPLAERGFIINEKGIDNIPPESKIAKKMEEKEKRFEKSQSQETIIESKKKKEEEEENDGQTNTTDTENV
jgi:DNA repair protein RadA